jgi:O-methyltransferase
MTYQNLTEFRKKQVEENKDFLSDKLFLEFGVFQGNSILEYYSAYRHSSIKPTFFGFDSFEGLPDEKLDPHSPWKVGDFDVNGHINPELLNKEGMEIIPGWFNKTLNADTKKKFKRKKAGLVHIDCDIYTSTLEVLEFLVTNNLLVDGTLIVYDDWGAWKQARLTEDKQYDLAEGRAHKEIAKKYGLKFELVGTECIDPLYYFVATFKYCK